MPIRVTCEDCGHKFSAPDSRAGKTVACDECDETVRVPNAKATAAPVAKAVPSVKAVPAVKVVKKKIVVEDDGDDDEDEAPRYRKQPAKAAKKSKLPLLIMAGVGAIVLLGAGSVAAFFALKKDDPKVVAEGTPAPGDLTPPVPVANPNPPEIKHNPPVKPETQVSTPTQPPEPKPVEVKPPETKPVITKPMDKPIVETKPLTPVRRDTPDKSTFGKMKRATVYIEIEDQRGGGSSGTGWFGLDENLIVTNAHVLGMKAPGSKEPKKITIFVDPGQKGQQKFEGPKVKLLAVDRDMDLALLEIIQPENALPKPLKTRPSDELEELEKLTVLGFPGGRRIAERNRSEDPPTVSIAETKVQALRKDTFGDLYSVQVQGGLVHGNSGGPICDGDGAVVAVAVRVDLDNEGRFTNIAYGVPTEYVRGLIAGRIANVEYGAAFLQDGKTHVPVKVNCLDPRKQLKEIGMACWLGDAGDSVRSPGDERLVKPDDANLLEVRMAYDAEKQVAVGELVYPPQEAGKVYFSQPYFSSNTVPKRWMAGNLVKLSGPAYERKATDLTARFKIGSKRPITVVRVSDLQQLEDGEGSEKETKLLLQQTLKLTEELGKPADATTLAKVLYRFDSMDLKIKRGSKEIPAPKEVIEFINAGIKLVTATGTFLRNGEITKMLVQTFNIPDNSPLKQLYMSQGQELIETLHEGSIGLPNKKMNSGDTWKATKYLRFAFQSGEVDRLENRTKVKVKEYAFQEEITYTYLGIRERLGRREAVVSVEGNISPMGGAAAGSASGTVKGMVLVEEDTGMIVESDMKRQFEIDSSEKGVKKRLSGVDEFKITRGPNAN